MPYLLAFLALILIGAAVYFWYTNTWRPSNAIPIKKVFESEELVVWIVCDTNDRFWIKVNYQKGRVKFIGPYPTLNKAWDLAKMMDVEGLRH